MATLAGTLISAVAAALISFSQELFSIAISFLWIIPVSFLVGIVIGVVFSVIPFREVPVGTDKK